MALSPLHARVGSRIKSLRLALGLSQEQVAHQARIDRTYFSDVERGVRNLGLENLGKIAAALRVPPESLFSEASAIPPSYRVRTEFEHYCGFSVSGNDVVAAMNNTATELRALPFSFYRCVDLKTLSGIAGAIFASAVADATGSIVNPIEKGHPDVVPPQAVDASEAELRNYPEGLEIKCTVGNVRKGSDLSAGEPRISSLTSVTWQAHHREVGELLGLIVDFAGDDTLHGRFPIITAAFFSADLETDDWGAISGTTGRNTKVTAMLKSGKTKMGAGWIALLDNEAYLPPYRRALAIPDV